MVPVRKPGRPLSACPHPRDQACGCGGVTAAIPRKHTCHCGGDTSVPVPTPIELVPRDGNGSLAEASSPTRGPSKIQKASARPQSNRKLSFDPANFERMDMNSVNIVPFEQRPSGVVPIPFPSGYAISGTPQEYGFIPQYANVQPHYGHLPMQAPPHIPSPNGRMNGITNGAHQKGLGHVAAEISMGMPMELKNGGLGYRENGTSCCPPPSSTKVTNGETSDTSNGSNESSCCTPKQSSHSHNSSSASSISEPQEPNGSCCSSNAVPEMVKPESASNQGTPLNMTPQMGHQILPENGMPFNPALYPQYPPHPTVFTYPPTYGSFQNPLQPSAWRQGVRAVSYAAPQFQNSMASGAVPFVTPVIPETNDTIHTCSCGDTCQCIGCAAHPYNDATQDYVRSAWSSMAPERRTSELYTNGQYSNGNGNGNGNVAADGSHGVETVPSPTASTASGNGEEQSLSASDFFFVNYPFSPDGCGGDTQSCPCGDDCQCLGCTIHRQPPSMPCGGEKEICPCGDDCECIGCEIHKGRVGLTVA
jgi:hypothetical protein